MPEARPHAFVLFLAACSAVLSGVALAIEASTHMCAEAFFDPLPTPLHAGLIGLVALTQAILVLAAVGVEPLRRSPLGLLHGLATGVALLYAVAFLPLTPLGFLGIVAWGLGLLALAPLAALVSLGVLRTQRKDPGFVPGLVLGVLLLLLADLPHEVARVGLTLTASESTAQTGLDLLRSNDEEALRILCYGDFQRPLDFLGSVAGIVQTDPLEARKAYYRAYGRPFQALPRPPLPRRVGFGRQGADLDQGGEEVGGRLPGLSLVRSHLRGVVEGPASYAEWTMDFHNAAAEPAEARAEVALPPGGVVSRATLWIDGQEREAAYGGSAQVRQAYERVVAQRRDPLLVTWAGPGRVLVQCFPVPPGKTMRIRLGISAPLELEERARMLLPRFEDHNFEIPAAPEFALPGPVRDRAVEVPRPAGDRWVRDGVTAVRAPRPPLPRKLVVAVDGSAGMQAHAEAVAAALPPEATVLVSTDGPPRQLKPAGLPTFRFLGGRDAMPLLLEAARLAGPEGAVLWVHAPQPVLLQEPQPLPCRLLDYSVEPGRHAVRAALEPEPLRELGASPGHRLVFSGPGTGPGSHLERLWAAAEVERLAASAPQKAVALAVQHRLVTRVSGAVVLETQAQYDAAGLQPVEPGTVPSIPEPAEWLLLALAAAVLARARRRR